MPEDKTTRGPHTKSNLELAWGVPSQKEPRLQASIAIVLAMLLYFVLPTRYTIGPNWLVPALELSILLPVTIHAPHRIASESPVLRWCAMALITMVSIENLASLSILVYMLVWRPAEVQGEELLIAGACIWLTNVIVFALWYWEIDRGGPNERTHPKHSAPDFLFPQMNTPGTAPETWTPQFLDYVYLAYTNATAFSPTDVLPLTKQAKMLMLAQSAIALVTIVLVASRAVNILK